MGRVYFAEPDALRDLAVGIFVAAVLAGMVQSTEPVACLLSGGNVEPALFERLTT